MKKINFTQVALVLGVICAMANLTPASANNPYAKNAGESYRKLPNVKKGGTIYLQESTNPKVLNPLLVTDVDYADIIPWIYSSLMQKDDETNEYSYLLAEKLDVSKDHKVLTYTLRKDAVWDDGTPVTADDAEYTFNTMMDPKVEAASLRAYFDGFKFEKIDQHSFRFNVASPNVNTIDFVNDSFAIIQKKQFANVPDFNKGKGIIEPVGNGPYKVKSFSRDQRLELERNPTWWGYKIPENKNQFNFDTLYFRIIPDAALAYEKLLKGDLDILSMTSDIFGNKVRGIDKDKFGKDASTDKAVWAAHIKTEAPAPWSYIGWNNKRDIFASKKTRQALAHLINYDEIINKVYYGEAIRCISPFGSLTPNTAPNQKEKIFDFNVSKGIATLEADGWSDMDHTSTLSKMINGKKVKFEFTLRYNSENTMRAKMAQMIKETFKKAGITVNVQALEFNALLDVMDNRDFDAVIMGWGNGMLHSDSKQLWHSKSWLNKGSNYIGYSNPDVDALIEKANAELSGAKHFKITQKIGALIYDDQPYAFLVEVPGFIAGFQTRKVKAKTWAMKYDSKPNIPIYAAP
jgi:peptide/nickel transport system substrate-binding protein